jgi:hypothetical protein
LAGDPHAQDFAGFLRYPAGFDFRVFRNLRTARGRDEDGAAQRPARGKGRRVWE